METGNRNMNPFARIIVRVIVMFAVAAGGSAPAGLVRAQVPVAPSGEADQNKKLRVQLDRATIRAFESFAVQAR